jgi:tetratricopeptide (TPR) repeat protein
MKYIPAAALVAIAFLVYFPASSAGFIWDDDFYVTRNTTLHDAGGLARIWLEPTASPQYYPLVFTSFWLEYQLWQLKPRGYHLTNVFLHAANGVLVWLLLRRLRVPAPWIVAALFVVHPVHVESVMWVTERKNVLSGLFYLAAALSYFRFRPPEPGDVRGGAFWYVLAFVLFLAALFCKTVTCTLPAAILLVLAWRDTIRRRDVLLLLPFFAVGAAMGFVTAWLEKHHVGASEVLVLTPVQRLLIAGRAPWFYAGKLLWPAELMFNYPRWDVDPSNAGQWLYVLLTIAALGIGWFGRRLWGAGPLVACLFFGGTLVPALGFFDVYPMRYSFVADHFQYLASLGPLALFVAIADAFVRQTPLARGRHAIMLRNVAVAGLLVALGLSTTAHAFVFHDLRTLWADTLRKNPDSWLAHNNLGQIYVDEGQLDKAVEHLDQSLHINAVNPEALNNLGTVAAKRERWHEALDYFRRSSELRSDHPNTMSNLGATYAQLGQFDLALRYARRAVELRPGDAFYEGQLAEIQRLKAESERPKQ